MIHNKFLFIVFTLLMTSLFSYGQLANTPIESKKYSVQELSHPGIMHSREELSILKGHVNNGEEPWARAYKAMEAWKGSSLNWTPSPFEHVHRDSYGANRVGDPQIGNDAEAAYSHAIQWIVTGNKAHAEKTIEILNAWSGTIETITGKDDNLVAGMIAHKFCNAAEIIRHTYDNWAEDDVDQFKGMMRDVFYPLISNYYTNSLNSNGNWGLSMVNSVLAIAVFCDDVELFNNAVSHVMGTNAQPYSTFSGYIDANTGQCQESGRDQGHSQMGLGYLAAISEIAWKQGVDLYGYLDNRLLHGFEYFAKYNLGGDVPYYNMYGKFKDVISEKSRGKYEPVFERVYNHYVRVKKLPMPYTQQIVDKIRPEGFTSSMISWGTLTGYQGEPMDSND
ncbi:alginate lyase family protein [Mariniflexile sp. AS56]|uniref:alginate lyase family protein n=1 Tax=Mariniflexile sp. AS56 TaxID=3063957 RepID=UPI0026F0B565|nr:alginate lyase family protein [Mariniflexile sp. AS56]MDO7172238.1 alginate lyase family protein [Mariniflexile sp. AS56]